MNVIELNDLPAAFAPKGQNYYNNWGDLKYVPCISTGNVDYHAKGYCYKSILTMVQKYNIQVAFPLASKLQHFMDPYTNASDLQLLHYLVFCKPLSVLFCSDSSYLISCGCKLSEFISEVSLYYEIRRFKRIKKAKKRHKNM